MRNVQESVDKAIDDGADVVVAVGHLGVDGITDGWKSTDVIAGTTGIDYSGGKISFVFTGTETAIADLFFSCREWLFLTDIFNSHDVALLQFKSACNRQVQWHNLIKMLENIK